MRVPTNTLSPLIHYWSAMYVSALLSVYTLGVLALSRTAKLFPAKPIGSHPGLKS